MAQNILRRFIGPKKRLTSGVPAAWAPIYDPGEVDGSADGSFLANDLTVVIEVTNDPTDVTAKYQISPGSGVAVRIPGTLYWRAQDPNRTRAAVAQQVGL